MLSRVAHYWSWLISPLWTFPQLWDVKWIGIVWQALDSPYNERSESLLLRLWIGPAMLVFHSETCSMLLCKDPSMVTQNGSGHWWITNASKNLMKKSPLSERDHSGFKVYLWHLGSGADSWHHWFLLLSICQLSHDRWQLLDTTYMEYSVVLSWIQRIHFGTSDAIIIFCSLSSVNFHVWFSCLCCMRWESVDDLFICMGWKFWEA